MTDWKAFLRNLEGKSIPGGCDDCNAYQRIRQHGAGWAIGVFHDDTCPTLAKKHASEAITEWWRENRES